MAGSINKVILLGRLGADPEIRVSQDGKKIARFSLATSESWKDKITSEKKEKTEWHKIVIFSSGLAEISEKYLKKGSLIYIEGQISTSATHDGNGAKNGNGTHSQVSTKSNVVPPRFVKYTADS